MSAVLTPKLETLYLAKTPLFMVHVRLPGKVKCSYLEGETTPGRSAEVLSKALFEVIDTVFHSCRISRVASLDFDMTLGGCATSRGFTVLCFDRNATQKCYYTRYETHYFMLVLVSSQSPLGTFNEVDESSYEHKITRIAASSTEVMAIGSRQPDHARDFEHKTL